MSTGGSRTASGAFWNAAATATERIGVGSVGRYGASGGGKERENAWRQTAKGETILARSVRRGHSWPRKKDGGGGSSGRRGWKMKENEVRWRRDGQPRGGNKKRQKSTACARGVQTPVTKESGQMQPIAYRVLSSTTCVTKIALTCKIHSRRPCRTRRGTGAPIRCIRAGR